LVIKNLCVNLTLRKIKNIFDSLKREFIN
jgi:hypothetical protein